MMVPNQFVSRGGGKALRMKQEVLLDFIPNRLCQQQPRDLRGAKGKHRFIQTPFGDDAAEEYV